jgi:hypothetical protein
MIRVAHPLQKRNDEEEAVDYRFCVAFLCRDEGSAFCR